MIQSNGNNQFEDNRFDFWTWSAPVLQTQEEVIAKVEEMNLVGRTIKDIRTVGENYGFTSCDCFYDIFEAIQRGDDEALETLEFPCEITVDEPMLIQFEDGDILGIDYSEGSSIRMELNTLPWDIQHGINFRNFHVNRMFKDILGREIGDVFITTSVNSPIFTRSYGLELANQSSYLHSLSFCCIYDGPKRDVPGRINLKFESDLDYGFVCLEGETSLMKLPARCIKEIMEGYLTPDSLRNYLGQF